MALYINIQLILYLKWDEIATFFLNIGRN